jgi:hypothetical protein
MTPEILCPNCKYPLPVDSMGQGGAAVCPTCDSLIAVPDVSGSTAVPSVAFSESPLEGSKGPLPHPDRLESLRNECRALAARHGADLDETFRASFRNGHNALDQNQYQDARSVLPEIPPYRSRNVLPRGAFASMLFGALLAIPAAMAVELSVSLPTAVFIAITINALTNYAGSGAFLLGIALVLAFTVPFLVGGWTSAWIVTRMGRWRKNRNLWVAAILASVAAGISVLLLWSAHLKFGTEPFRAWDPFKMRQNLDAITSLFFGANFVVAMVCGGRFAAGMVRKSRFCEECHEFLDLSVSKSLRVGVIKAMLLAIASASMPMVAVLLTEEDGEDGSLSVYRCPVCGGGILELAVSTNALDKHSQYVQKTWYVASIDLEKQDVEWFGAVGK